MAKRKGTGWGAAAGALLLTLLFVGYRARTFHYCATLGDRPEAHIVSAPQTCGPDEEPLEWRRVGAFGKIKLVARSAAKAFGAD